ncbi:hypothetical protein [Paralysiella testudinis]|uniref:Uncharacterized protein n=1 Tax=Paralysiella testudinis TaxID=2809020 RepID=A0A892ZFF3_9NEIS|nr:hypothetical protein [Paralysiella testudinis]QRQ82165.1 hypothetical protein JQU52_01665 [Paralysiella testudinis]
MQAINKILFTAILALPLLASAQGLKLQKSADDADYYDGQITVRGQYTRNLNDEILGDAVCFNVDDADAALIPRRGGDARSAWFCFSNQDTAVNTFKLGNKPPRGYCGHQGRATVTVNQYVVYAGESEGTDVAKLVSARGISKAQPVRCYQGE